MPEGEKRRILVVDDEPMIRRAIIRLFRDSFELVEAADRRHAVELLETFPCAAVLCDATSASREFLELARRLQPKCRRVVSSSLPVEWSADLVDAWFPRPWDSESALAVLRKLVQKGDCV